jgi:molybdate transport system substrate-binding protein
MSHCGRDRQNKRPILFWVFCFFLMHSLSWASDDLKIAAAASLRDPLEKIARAFERENNLSIRISYGASGSLVTQLIHGAPFDLFLSANEDDPQKLIGEGLSEAKFQFATGRLVLWIPEGSRLNLKKDQMQTLLNPAIRKIAIANPLHAPYGRAAVSALKHFGYYEKVLPRLIYGEDIAQAVQFLESGGADIGILAYSIVIQGGRGEYFLIPSEAHPPLRQVGVILKRSGSQGVSKKFMEWMLAGKGKDILQEYGYTK